MALDKKALAAAKRFTSDTADSLGAVKGAPATIKSITEVDGGQKVTFEWTGTSGTKQTSEMTVKNGVSVTGISDKGNGKFTLLLSDGSETDPIQTVKGQKGDKLTFNDLTDEEKASLKGADGFSPTITENADNTDKIYKLDITTADSTFTTPNLKGADGTGGEGASTWSEISDKPFESLSTDFSVENGELKVVGGTGGSGEENKINSISVNGTPISADINKNVDITVPTVTNDLTDELKSSYDDAVTAKHTHENGTVLDGITAEKVEAWDKAEKNVQSDWNETDDAADGFIKNKPTIPDAYDDTALSGRVDDVETSIGDMSTIKVKSVSDLVSAINTLYDAFMSSITYADKKLTITYRNGGTVDIDMSAIITDTNIGELSNIDDTGVADKQVLSYDTATNKYIPTTIDTAGVLADAKKYTDDEIAKINNADAMAVDEKPTYSDGTITYKKDGVENTITDGDFWFFYTVDDMAYQTIWIDGVEFTTSVDGSVDFKDFVSKTNDLVSTYTGEETDKTKVTTIASLDALYAIISTALGKKVNTTDIIDNLASDSTDKPLSAAQGKALDTKISDLITTVEEDYAKKTDLHSHTNKTVLDGITEEKVTAWDKAQENVLETIKINNQEITPDENKAVNIDLSGYAEHDEIIGENLIPYPYAQPERTTNGITFTFADDGSVIANGTATADADFSVCVRTNFGTDKAFMLKPGTYAITGCPEGGSDSTYRIHVQFGDKSGVKYTLKADYGDGFVFEVTEEHAQYACQIQCHVQKGYTVTDLVFKPMLVLGSVLKEYQPYKLSRESLRTDIDDVTELASKVDNQFATANGDYITVTDSVDGKLVELGIKGNSVQQTYSGKNLLIYPYAQTTKNTNGVDFTDLGDGSILVNRVDSSITDTAYFQPTYRIGDSPSNLYLEDGDYTMYCFGGDEYCYLEIFATTADESGTVLLGDTKNGGILNFTVTNSEYANNGQLGVTFYVKTEATVSNRTFKFMICKGTLDSTEIYEPYVGGIPAPSPLYPQAINSVGDDGSLVVKSCGKNLIPLPYYNGSDTRNGITATVNSDDGLITLNGTATSNYFFVLLHRDYNGKGFARQFRGKTVTISGGTASPVLSFAVYDENGNNITPPKNEMIYDFGSGITVTIPDNACDIYSYYYCSSGVTINKTFKPQLEVGEVITKYEPYKSSTTTIPLSEPLRAIGDIKDEITYQDGKWGVLRWIKRLSLDTPLYVSKTDDFVYDMMAKFDSLYDSFNYVNNKSDIEKCRFEKFESQIIYQTDLCGAYISWSGSVNARLSSSICGDSSEEALAYFKNNPLVIEYVLATPVFEPFKDQTLPYQLATYNGVTNIFSDDALSTEMTVKYPTTDVSGVGSRNESRIAELEETKADKCKVADTDWTDCTLQDDFTGFVKYRVKNGICFVWVSDFSSDTAMSLGNQLVCTGLPKHDLNADTYWGLTTNSLAPFDSLILNVNSSQELRTHLGTNSAKYFGSFSYPVSES